MRPVILELGSIYGTFKIIACAGSKGKKKRICWRIQCINCGVMSERTSTDIKRCSRVDSTKMARCQYCFGKKKGESGFAKLFYGYKRMSLQRNLNFDLTEEEFRTLTQLPCHYCNIKPYRVFESNAAISSWGHYIYNGIDRKNTNIGYTMDNSVACCWFCNRAKNDSTYDEYVNWIKQIKAYSLL